MSAEENGKPSAEMAALVAKAGAVDAETSPQGSVGMGAPEGAGTPGTSLVAQDQLQQMRGQIGTMLSVLVELGKSLYPDLEKVWTEQAIAAVADRAAAVAVKRGWAVKFLAGYDEELLLLVTLFPLVQPTWKLIAPKPEEKPVEGERVDTAKPAAAAPAQEPAAATEDDVLSRPVSVTVQR